MWDAPGHAASWPFAFDFDLMDKARWLDGILEQEGITKPVIVGQSMGGYVGQAYAQTYPEKLKGFVSIDSAPLQRKYMTKPELWLLKRMEIVYRCYPWKALLKSGTKGVALSEYGRNLMRDMMLVYDGDQKRYAKMPVTASESLPRRWSGICRMKSNAPPCSSAANRTRRGLALDTIRRGMRTPEFPWNGSKMLGTTPTPTSRKS